MLNPNETYAINYLIEKLDDIIADEKNECNVKYKLLVNKLMPIDEFSAGVVEKIRTDECGHAKLYEQIQSKLKALRA